MNNPKLKNLIESTWYEQQQEIVEPQQIPLTQEEKLSFLGRVKEYGKYGKAIYNEHDLIKIAEELSKLAEDAERVTLSEIDDKFDEISVKRNVKELKTLSGQFAKAAVEAQTLKNRMTTLFEDMGNILGRYYSINEDLKLSGDVTSSDIVDTAVATGQKTNNLDPSDATEFKKEKDRLEKKIH